jgi:hypothetical protein
MKRTKTARTEKRDALLAEMASLRGLPNGSLVQRYSTCSRKNWIGLTVTDAKGRQACRNCWATVSAAAAANGWDGETARLLLATVLVKKAGSDQSGTVYAMRDMGEDRARFRDSALADSQTMVDVWEVYYETADLGRRVCCFCPQFPDLVLSDRPWTWIALIGAESEPPAREDSMTQTLGPESVKAFMLWIFNTVDTELARKIQGQGGWRQVKGFA